MTYIFNRNVTFAASVKVTKNDEQRAARLAVGTDYVTLRSNGTGQYS